MLTHEADTDLLDNGGWRMADGGKLYRDPQSGEACNPVEAVRRQMDRQGLLDTSPTVRFKGVYRYSRVQRGKTWAAQIHSKRHGRWSNRWIGYFATPEQARDARAKAVTDAIREEHTGADCPN
jgi:hypothetical protein